MVYRFESCLRVQVNELILTTLRIVKLLTYVCNGEYLRCDSLSHVRERLISATALLVSHLIIYCIIRITVTGLKV